MTRTRRRITTAGAAVAALTALAGCGGGADEGGADAITVWTTDSLPDRMAQARAIGEDFTAETGIEVEFVGVAEDQFAQLLTSAAAAGDLPDVIGSIGLSQVRTLSANDLVDTQATGEVVDALGEETFTEAALELTREGDDQLAVPSESWSQLLYYRTDLFEAAGLEPPETYEDIRAAAEALDGPEMAGFVGATAAGDAFTQQTFEHIALGNDCQMVDDSGEIAIASDRCVEAFDFYGSLVQDYSTAGAQDVDTVRASYFAGQAAMAIWSTYLLDELAGLREDAMPTCPECVDNPRFLAENTGVVTAIQGPSGEDPAQFGAITSWAITANSATDPSKQFVEYMLSDGYVPWLAIAPEGKVPVRQGTAEEPAKFADAWATLDVGVDTQAPLSDIYAEDVIQALQTGPEELDLWGIGEGHGDLVGAALGELPIAAAVSEVAAGADPQQAAEQAAAALRNIQDSLQ